MSNSLSRAVALMFLLALALPASLLAQTKDTADIGGVVLDASGQPAAGYAMKITTPEHGEVIINPTAGDGTFGVEGLPPGSYELRVFEPDGMAGKPIASKQVTLAAGQVERIEIRLASGATTSPSAAAATLGTFGVNWTTVLIAALVLAAALGVFFAVRVQRRPAE